ncbi:MAG: peptidase M28 family protein, partial [Flavobacteriales bacterium]
MKKILFLIFVSFLVSACNTKSNQKVTQHFSSEERIDSTNIKSLFNSVLKEGKSYEWLRDLTQNIGGRLSGSPEAAKAVVWGEKLMNTIGLDSVWLQPVIVPHWVRGEKEIARYTANGIQKNVPICALGFSVATPKTGV